MQKYLKKGRLTAWLLASALFVGSMPMSVMAEEPGGAAAGKTAVYFVADSEVEGVPFEELVSGMESFMESSADGTGAEPVFPQEEPYALQYEPASYASLEDLAGEVLASDESSAYLETGSAVIVTGEETARQVQGEGTFVTEEGDEVDIRIDTYQEAGILTPEEAGAALQPEEDSAQGGEEPGVQAQAETQTSTAQAAGAVAAASGSRSGALLSSIKTETPSVASGSGNLFKMYYGVSADAYGTITVVGPDGSTVRTLYDDFLHKQGYYLLTWDLRKADGTYAAEGRYTVKMSFRTSGGTVDTSALSFDIAGLTLSSVKGDRTEMSQGETLTFYYQIDRAAKGTIGVYNEAGEEVRNIYDEYQHAAGYYKAMWNGKDSSGAPVPTGTYTVRIAFGNVKAELEVKVKDAVLISGLKAVKQEADTSRGDVIDMYYSVLQPSTGDVAVYNSRGSLVKTLYDSAWHSAGYYRLTWNLKNAAGSYVESGEYTIRYRFTLGSAVQEEEITVTVAGGSQASPVLSSVKLEKATVDLAKGETVKFYYGLTEAASGDITVYNSAGSEVAKLYDDFLHSAGYYAAIWNGKDKSGAAVPSGEYTICLEFQGDKAELKVTVRNEAASGQDFELSGIKVAESPLYWGETAKIYYNLTGDSTGTVTVKNEDGDTVKTLYNAFPHAKGYYVVNWNLKDESGDYVPAGKYTVELDFTSGSYRHTGETELRVRMPISSLELSSIKASETAINVEKSSSVDIFYSVSEDSKGTVQICNEDGTVVRTFYDGTSHAAGYYKVTWNLKDASGQSVPEGVYTVKFRFTDGIKTVEEELDLELVGNFALTHVYTDPERVNLSCDESVKLNYSITEGSTGTIQIYNESGKVVHTFYNSFYHAAGYYASTWNLKGSDGQTVPLGHYEIRMRFVKADGSLAERTVGFDIVDELALNSVKVTPEEAGPGQTVSLYYLPTKDSKGTIQVYNEDGEVVRTWYEGYPHTAGYYKITWDQTDSSGKQVDRGRYTFRLEFEDADTMVETEIFVDLIDVVSKKIYIDAGHGGIDPGAVSNGRYEREDNLKLALELQRVLEQQGQQVFMARVDSDPGYTDLTSLRQRIEESNSYQTDVFVSLHRDSASASARGYTVYTHNASDPVNYNPNAYANKNSGCTALSEAINSELGKVGSLSSRGIVYGSAGGTDDLMVNRLSNMPSCLIEMGFITNQNDNYLFDAYLKQHAKAIAKGIMNYLGVPFDESKYTSS